MGKCVLYNSATFFTLGYSLTHIGHWRIGQEVTAWGKYVDTLTLFPEGQQNVLPGSSGQWLISKREVGFMKRLGEEGVMDGE